VRRELATFTVVVVGLASVAQACGAPDTEVPPDSAQAQATAVRRTEVAQVQEIIANHPTSTPRPPGTPTPTPTCKNAIWWVDARNHVGESPTLEGPVIATRPAPGGMTMLEIGQAYPDPLGLAVLVPSVPPDLVGRSICLTGQITLAEGRPTVQVRDAATIAVVR
jgi:hypothetical protein